VVERLCNGWAALASRVAHGLRGIGARQIAKIVGLVGWPLVAEAVGSGLQQDDAPGIATPKPIDPLRSNMRVSLSKGLGIGPQVLSLVPSSSTFLSSCDHFAREQGAEAAP